ncbi:hypothetical protein F5X99DRAFT_414838 [Biscogniauxia marginata]|nr:hypothetical protein F5X99DRAFT_414838 [Biscogniauxia marginata]
MAPSQAQYNRPIPIPGSQYIEHSRFPNVHRASTAVRDGRPEYGRRGILWCLHTNRRDAGEAKQLTHEEIFQVISDYYRMEYADRSAALSPARMHRSQQDLRRLEFYHDVNGPFHGGRLPALPAPAVVNAWKPEEAQSYALVARLGSLSQHIRAGLRNTAH